MSIKKYTDWKGWLKGFYLSWIKTLTSTALGYVGTNVTDQMLDSHIGLSINQAGSMALSITVVEALRYLNSKPAPEVVTESFETCTIAKDSEGVKTIIENKVTTETPKL